jgi:ABC-type lipopolysaccharide export system ATPase subunit
VFVLNAVVPSTEIAAKLFVPPEMVKVPAPLKTVGPVTVSEVALARFAATIAVEACDHPLAPIAIVIALAVIVVAGKSAKIATPATLILVSRVTVVQLGQKVPSKVAISDAPGTV